jgi:6-phosphogluconolactonase (cycloisomerase 2 family)
MTWKRLSLGTFGLIGLLTLFQNCGASGGFNSTPGQVSLGSNNGASTGGDSPTPTPVSSVTPPPGPPSTPTPTPTPVITPTPTPTPAQGALKKTQFYFGGLKTIDVLELNHTTGAVTSLASVPFAGSTAGWLAYDKTTESVFVVDIDKTNLQIFSHNPLSAALTSRVNLTGFPTQVHLSVVPTGTEFNIFGAAYFNGHFGYYKVNAAMNQFTTVQDFNLGSTAKTHSTAFDAKHGLLYVASLGLNKIAVYKFSAATGLTALTEIPLEGARTVVYDGQYDKLFVASEVSTGPSYIRIFSIQAAGNSFTFTDSGSLAMPKLGGDLKVNHKYQYVMATARETGKESIWGLPITAAGVADASRPSFSIPVSQQLPRALEVTEDGIYAFVGMNSSAAEGIAGYKMVFDANKKFMSAQKFYQRSAPPSGGYQGGLSIPVY